MDGIGGAVFWGVVAANLTLVAGAVWSVVFPEKRLWPPPGRGTWPYAVAWGFFWASFLAYAFLAVLDWNTWVVPDEIRFAVGVPVALVGGGCAVWGIVTLGTRNTAGLEDGFVLDGPYRFTRNPQYLGDMALFLGGGLVSNSVRVLVVGALIALVFALTPLAEEVWLEEHYGEAYRKYKRETPRFL